MAVRSNRRQRRRGRFGFLYKLLSFVLIIGAIALGCIVFFRVEKVTVVGSTVYTQEEVVAAAGVEQGDNLFLVGIVQTGRRIRSQLPYINDVNIRRQLPDGLLITVTECSAAGVLEGEKGTWWALDSGGKLLEQGGSELTRQYPIITGLTALMPAEGDALMVSLEESAKLNSLKQLLKALQERNMLDQTQSIDLANAAEIHMKYENRFRVQMPLYSEDFPMLVLILEQASAQLDAGQTGTIDLTMDLNLEKGRFIPD